MTWYVHGGWRNPENERMQDREKIKTQTWPDCLITTRIASGCKVCGAKSSDENPTHVWENVFYCGRCCPFHKAPEPHEWVNDHKPLIGQQNSLFGTEGE